MMDFLDPKKTRAATIRLITGYVLMAVALVLAAYVLFNLASGFGVQQGKVIQNGLVFVSTSPSGSSIYLNNQLRDEKSNSRLVLPAGTYTMKLAKSGYRDWQRALTVEGGSVERFDYPMLIPKELETKAISGYSSAPLLASQSPDRRWLLVQPASAQNGTFDVYDLRDPEKVLASKKTITVPAEVFGIAQQGQQTLQLEEWSRDNDHVLLRHTVDGQTEYVMISRTKPEESFNVTKKLQLNATSQVSLQDKKYDKYFVHDTAAGTLSTATFDEPALVAVLQNVISYKTYGQDVVLYATSDGAVEGKVAVKIYQDKQSYLVRQVTKDSQYLLDLTTYDSDWYAAIGTPGEGHVYIYKNPSQRVREDSKQPLVPVENLKLAGPNYVEFSANSQFLMAENGQDIAVFDAENERSYTYRIDKQLDQPQTHVTWMDGHRLTLVSGGLVTIFDYDGTNMQSLAAGNAAYLPVFDTAYRYQYSIAAAGTDKTATVSSLYGTALRTSDDL